MRLSARCARAPSYSPLSPASQILPDQLSHSQLSVVSLSVFDGFQCEGELFSSKQKAKILFPELPHESQSGKAIIQINEKLQSQNLPNGSRLQFLPDDLETSLSVVVGVVGRFEIVK